MKLTEAPSGRQGASAPAMGGSHLCVGALGAVLVALGCSAPSDRQEPGTVPTVRFRDVSAEAGIDFTHTSGRTGRKYAVETIGSGAAALDYDGDGYIDLYVVDSGDLPGFVSETPPRNALYHSLGPARGWTFEDRAAEAAVDDAGYGMGVAVGDVDNDQDPDLFVTNFGANRLFLNDGGTAGTVRFADVSASSDVGLDTSWSTGAAFADIDLDGDLDLYVANYLDFAFDEADSALIRPRRHIAPTEYPGRRDFLYRNDGDGGFRDVTETAGLLSVECRELGALFFDYDRDGDPDLFQGNDATPNFLYRNEGDGTFVEVGLRSGVAYDESGRPEGTMGVAAGDVDGDGWQDLVMTNFQWESNTLYRALPSGGFEDVSRTSGLGAPSFDRLAFGINLFDPDNDGDQDLFVVNGHIDEDIERFDPQATYAQPDQLFLNDGHGRFEDVSSLAGEPFARAFVGRGSVALDYDDDGDQDLFVVNSAGPAQLLRNDTPGENHWLAVRLRGWVSNRDGFGAELRLVCGADAWVREHRSAVSYLSQDDPRLHFGLGRCGRVDSLVVTWPSGHIQTLTDLAADRVLDVDEPVAALAAGTVRPQTRRLQTAAAPPATADGVGVASAWEQAGMVLPPEVRATRQVPDLDGEHAAFESSKRGGGAEATAHLRWAEVLRLHRRHDEAEGHYRLAGESAATRGAALVGLGQLRTADGDLAAALAAYREAMDADDTSAAPHYYSGNLLVRQGNLADAVAHYERALERDPRHLRTYVNLGSVHARQTDYGPAVRTLRHGIEALPEQAELRLQLARILFVQTRHEEAVEQLQVLIGLGGERPEACELLARVELAQGHSDRALEWLRRGLRLAPDSAELVARLGITLVETGSLTEALPYLQRAVRLDPDRAEALYHLGRLSLQLGDAATGDAVLERFERLQTHHADLLNSKTGVVLNPHDSGSYYDLGAVYSRIGRLEAARQAYRAALTIDPHHLDALNNLGNVYLRRRQLDLAIDTYRRVLAVDSTYVRAYHNLGNVWLLSAEPARAVAAFQRAVALDPGYAPARDALEQLSARAGRQPQAGRLIDRR